MASGSAGPAFVVGFVMPHHDDILERQKLLAVHRRTLMHLCRQAAQYGGELAAPPHIANGIYEARRNISGIKGVLRSWGVSSEDLPEEQESATDTLSARLSPPQQVSQGVLGLIQLLHEPQIHNAIISFRTDFEAVCDHVKVLNYYKRLHDLFQDLETRYYIVEFERLRLAEHPKSWDSLTLHEPEIQSSIEELLNTTSPTEFITTNAWWTEQLTQIRSELHAAVGTMNEALLSAAQRRLYTVLYREPSRINTRLVAEADALRLNVLIAAITIVRDRISALAATIVFEQLHTSLEALTTLNTTLLRRVSTHQFWQNLDDELRRVEANISSDISEFVLAWPDLKVMTIKLYDGNKGDWVVALQQIVVDLEGALAIQAADKIRRLFYQYRSRASRRFRQVDHELLELCNDLQKIGYALSTLVRALE